VDFAEIPVDFCDLLLKSSGCLWVSAKIHLMLIEIQWIPVDYSQNPVDFGDVLSTSVDFCRFVIKMLWILVDLGKEHIFVFLLNSRGCLWNLVKINYILADVCQTPCVFSGVWSKSSGCLWLLIQIHWMLMDFEKKHVGFLRILLTFSGCGIFCQNPKIFCGCWSKSGRFRDPFDLGGLLSKSSGFGWISGSSLGSLSF